MECCLDHGESFRNRRVGLGAPRIADSSLSGREVDEDLTAIINAFGR